MLEKRTNTSAWNLYDNKRTTGGVAGFNIAANGTPASQPHVAMLTQLMLVCIFLVMDLDHLVL